MLWEGLIKASALTSALHIHTYIYIHTYIITYNRYWHSGILQIYQNTLAKNCDNKMTQPPYSNHYIKCIVSKKTKPTWKIQITHLKDRNHVYKIHRNKELSLLIWKCLCTSYIVSKYPLDSSYKRVKGKESNYEHSKTW